MKKSIHHYFFFSISLVLIVSIVILGIIQSYLYTNHFTKQNQKELLQVVVNVEKAIQMGEIDIEEGKTSPIDYMADVTESVIFLTDLEGNIIYISNIDTNQYELITEKISSDIIDEIKQNGIYSKLGKLDGAYKDKEYTLGFPIVGQKSEKIGYIFVNNNIWGLKVYISDMLSSFFLAAALAIFLASILAWLLTQRTLEPIRKISETAKRFGQGDYTARVDIEGDNELAELAITFNEMANSFSASDSKRRSFMGDISHELRTPMTTIKGFVDGMIDGTIPENQRDKYLKIVSEEVGRLARLTHNMLDISKIEAGEYEIHESSFDIWGLLAQVFINAEKRLSEKKIQVEGLQIDSPVMVSADEDYIHQMLFNLLDNAIKFSDENSSIKITVKTNKNMVQVGIQNEGEEIPEEIIPYIFDRFYKGDTSRGINVKGSGLGLHICKVLIGLMGGRIWAQSKNKKTTFYFTVPAANKKIRPLSIIK